jgi:ubiquinone/menaquinone biosynthesis C-methylase UbiE
VTTEDQVRKVFGQRAGFYTTSPAHTDPQVLARVAALAAPQPDWLVLDIGTGTGHTAFALAKSVRAVVGTDLTLEMLREAAQLRTARGAANVRFTLADAHRLPFPSSAFHLITCRRAAHHFSNIGLALDEMHRVLRSGGRIVIDDRSIPEDDFVDACLNELDRYHDESHVRQYRASEWRRMLQDHGIVLESVETYTKHRPLTAFTGKASPENVRKIHAVIARLTSSQQAALNLRDVDGEPHLNHWYVTLAGNKP